MDNLQNKNVGDIVKENFRTATVFKEYGIDFCCGGQVTLADACQQKHIQSEDVIQRINTISDNSVPAGFDFDNWKLGFLADYIVNIHHQFVSANIPLILQYAVKVENVHSNDHPEVAEINNLFKEAANELLAHMQKEEKILFPLIKSLENDVYEPLADKTAHNKGLGNPIRVMVMEHENVGNILKEISLLSNEYQIPEGACNTFRVFYGKLKEFEDDLHQHIHLENNILFPKAIALENSVVN